MMKLACKDINPSSSCSFVAEGKTASEVAGKMMKHTKKDHPEDLAKMNMSDKDMMAMMEGKAHK